MDFDRIAVFDIESSGVDVYEDRIVSAFLGIMHKDGTLTDKVSWLINPGVEISQGAIDIHGITNERVKKEGQDAAEGVASIVAAINHFQSYGIPIAGFNLAYDLSLLHYEALRHGFTLDTPKLVIDGYVIDKAIDPYRKGKRTLTAQAAHYGIEVINAHDAEADCIVAGQLIFKLLDKVGSHTPERLHGAQVMWRKEQCASLESYFKRTDPNAVVDGQWPIRYKEEDK